MYVKPIRTTRPYLPLLEIPKPVLFSDPHKLYLELEDNGWFRHIDVSKAEEMIRFWETQKELAQMDALRKKSLRNRKKGEPAPKTIPSSGSFRDRMPTIWDEDDFPKQAPKLERRNAICIPEEEMDAFNPLNPDLWSWSDCPLSKELDELAKSVELKAPRPLHDIEAMLECREPEDPESRLTTCPPTPTNTPDFMIRDVLKIDWEELGSDKPIHQEPPTKRAKLY